MGNETRPAGKSAFARQRAKIGLGLLGTGVVALLMPAAAHADLIYSLSEPGFPSSVPLSTAGSSLTSAGPTTYNDFTYGNVDVNSNEGSSYAQLTLDSTTLTNTDPNNPHTVSILIADTDYNTPGGPGSTLSLTGAFSGTATIPALTTGTASLTSYADIANEQDPTNPANPATVTSITSPTIAFNFLSSFGGGTGTTFFTRSSVGNGDYSLAGVITITLSKGGSLTLNDNTFTFANQVVPEPTSLAMIAMGGLLLVRRRRTGKFA